jgi:hypothetical protein
LERDLINRATIVFNRAAATDSKPRRPTASGGDARFQSGRDDPKSTARYQIPKQSDERNPRRDEKFQPRDNKFQSREINFNREIKVSTARRFAPKGRLVSSRGSETNRCHASYRICK